MCNTLSYTFIITEEKVNNNLDFSFIANSYQEVILILEFFDLKWKDDIWKLMHRYLNAASYAATSFSDHRPVKCSIILIINV